jgi:hypothetical protein
MLTKFGAESGETNNKKVVDNFYILPESIDTPSYNQRFRSYDLCKLRDAAEISDLNRVMQLLDFGTWA